MEPEEAYVRIKEAAERPGSSTRQTDRLIKKGVQPSPARRQAKKRPELVTMYERPVAEVKKQEWWLLPRQQALMVAHWQTLRIPSTPYSGCPHEVNITVEGNQAPLDGLLHLTRGMRWNRDR